MQQFKIFLLKFSSLLIMYTVLITFNEIKLNIGTTLVLAKKRCLIFRTHGGFSQYLEHKEDTSLQNYTLSTENTFFF